MHTCHEHTRHEHTCRNPSRWSPTRGLAALVVLLLFGTPTLADEPETTAFDEILRHYETVRQALSADTLPRVSHHGQAIARIIESLATDWSVERAGVAPDRADEVRSLLPELVTAAETLAGAETLDEVRDAFYALSKPMVRFRKATTGERPLVAYCPMARRSWLQPEGELENPYYGQSMLRCGERIDG